MRNLAALALLLGVLGQASLGQTGAAQPSPPSFLDVTVQAGVKFRHQASHTSQKYLVEAMGSGVAWLDYDGDGLLDLFFVGGAALADPMPNGRTPDKSDPRYWNRLYRNTGRGTFEDVTDQAGVRGVGYGMGVAVGDYDNDGWPDLFVTNFGRNELYHNDGGGRFNEVTETAGVAGGGWSTGAAFLDYDGDGRLDLVVARYLQWDFSRNPWCGPERAEQRGYCHPNAFRPVSHLLYHNEGNGTFRDVSREAGLAAHSGKGLGVAIHDSDGDGLPDVLIANDSVAQQFFHNQGDGTFTEIALESGVAYNARGAAFAGMGVDWNDYDNDGRPDLFINALSLEGYTLFRNMGATYEDISDLAAITRITLPYGGWGTKFFDYDNDGWKDLFVAQGHVMDTIAVDFPLISYLQPLLLLRNRKGRFEDVSQSSGAAFRVPLASRGAAFGDFDNDGFIDVAVSNNNGPPLLLRNGGKHGNWLLLRLVGTRSNRDGIGATIRVVGESGFMQVGFVSTASSYLSASDSRVHFGLGHDRRAREVDIRWPSGATQRLSDVKCNQILTVREPR